MCFALVDLYFCLSFVFYILGIVLSILLRFTDFDYNFGMVKFVLLFLIPCNETGLRETNDLQEVIKLCTESEFSTYLLLDLSYSIFSFIFSILSFLSFFF